MEEKDIMVINTTKGELRYYRDWDNYEGGIVMMNAQTVKRYREIKDQHPDADECGVFFAFSNQHSVRGTSVLSSLGISRKATRFYGALEVLSAQKRAWISFSSSTRIEIPQ